MKIREQVVQQMGGATRAWITLHLLYHLLILDDELIGPEMAHCDCPIASEYMKVRG
jgi:hypothetical protein